MIFLFLIKLIYNKNNKLIGTTPYIINENKEIINK